MVVFEESPDHPQGWTEEEEEVVERQAQVSADRYANTVNSFRRWVNFWAWKSCDDKVYKSMVTADEAFVKIHQGKVHFLRSSSTPGNAGYTTGSNKITIYNIAGVPNYIVSHPRLITHELGHAFDLGTKGNVYAGFGNDLLRSGQNAHTDQTGRWFGFAGGWEVWQFGMANTPSEVFADMYIGWVYNTWDILDPLDPNDMGMKRQDFMNSTMLRNLVKYTDDIQ